MLPRCFEIRGVFCVKPLHSIIFSETWSLAAWNHLPMFHLILHHCQTAHACNPPVLWCWRFLKSNVNAILSPSVIFKTGPSLGDEEVAKQREKILAFAGIIQPVYWHRFGAFCFLNKESLAGLIKLLLPFCLSYIKALSKRNSPNLHCTNFPAHCEGFHTDWSWFPTAVTACEH